MKAIQITGFGGMETIILGDPAPPKPAADEVLVAVAAAGVNPVDWKIREGHMKDYFPFDFPTTIGSEVAGVIEAVGSGVDGFLPGEAVYGFTGSLGAFAEFAIVKAAALATTPGGISLTEAAALPVAIVTCSAAFKAAEIEPGTRLLIHAASGGVGTIAIQIAKALGAEVTALASAANLDFVLSLGADHAIDRTSDYENRIGHFDVVLDAFGPEAIARSWGLLRKGGILVSLVAPPDPEIAASHGVRATMTFGGPDAAAMAAANRLIEDGRLRPVISRTYPIEQGAAAIAEVEAGRVRGKVVLTLN